MAKPNPQNTPPAENGENQNGENQNGADNSAQNGASNDEATASTIRKRAQASEATKFKVLSLAFMLALKEEVNKLSEKAQNAFKELELQAEKVSVRPSVVSKENQLAVIQAKIDAIYDVGATRENMADLQKLFAEKEALEVKIAKAKAKSEEKEQPEQASEGASA